MSDLRITELHFHPRFSIMPASLLVAAAQPRANLSSVNTKVKGDPQAAASHHVLPFSECSPASDYALLHEIFTEGDRGVGPSGLCGCDDSPLLPVRTGGTRRTQSLSGGTRSRLSRRTLSGRTGRRLSRGALPGGTL